MAHCRSPYGGEQGNLVCRLPGTVSAPRRVLSAHIDTVPLCAGVRPVVRRNRVVPAEKTTALGGDDRAGATAILAAALEIVRRRLPHPPLVFLWTVQEELGLLGARHANLAMLGKPKLAFNFDGGSPEHVTIGATGGYRMQIRVRGIASHAGVAPDQGVSAIAIASLAIAELHREGWHGQVLKEGRSGTSNVGVIHGGEATNVVTPEVEVHAEARSHDAAFRRRIVAAIERAFRRAARSVKNAAGDHGIVQIHGRLDYESFRLDESEPSVVAAQAVVRAVGGEPSLAISNGGLDANWLTARGIPTVTLGTGVANAHTPEERLDLSQFRRACRIALRLATTSLMGLDTQDQ
jgi:tripeptide aminopeptidase